LNSAPRPTLLERARGPNARPVDLLVEEAAASAGRVAGQYRDFARARVEEIAACLKPLTGDAPARDWDALQDMVQDLRSSSATCGAQAMAQVARSWERALDPQYRAEPRLKAVMYLHLDALRLAVSDNHGGEALRALAGRLDSVVRSLNPTSTVA
jgi:hypothetical protein